MKLKHFLKNDGLAIIVISAIFLVVGIYGYPQNPSFMGIIPHPYFIVAILFSSYAGLRSGLAMAFVLSLQYLLILHNTVDYQDVETILAYKYLVTPVVIVIISTILGEFNTRQTKRYTNSVLKFNEQGEVITSLMNRVELLNEESREIKKQFISKIDTFATTTKRMQRFQQKNEDDIIQELMGFIEEDFGVSKAKVYKYREATSEFYPKEKHILDEAITNDPLFLAANDSKKPTFLKDYLRTTNKSNSILMACFPIILNEKVHAIIAIQEIKFLDHTPGNMLTIKHTVSWVELCLEYAREIRTLTQNSILNPELRIHTKQYFYDRLIEEHESAQRFSKEIHIIKLTVDGLMDLKPLKRGFARKAISQNLLSTLRKMDCICEGDAPDIFFVILNLPSSDHGKIALSRVEQSMFNLIDQVSAQDSLKTNIKLIQHIPTGTLENFKEIIHNA